MSNMQQDASRGAVNTSNEQTLSVRTRAGLVRSVAQILLDSNPDTDKAGMIEDIRKKLGFNKSQMRQALGTALTENAEQIEKNIKGLNKEQVAQIQKDIDAFDKKYGNRFDIVGDGVWENDGVERLLKKRASDIRQEEKHSIRQNAEKAEAERQEVKADVSKKVGEALTDPNREASDVLAVIQNAKLALGLTNQGVRDIIGEQLKGREGEIVKNLNKDQVDKLLGTLAAVKKEYSNGDLGLWETNKLERALNGRANEINAGIARERAEAQRKLTISTMDKTVAVLTDPQKSGEQMIAAIEGAKRTLNVDDRQISSFLGGAMAGKEAGAIAGLNAAHLEKLQKSLAAVQNRYGVEAVKGLQDAVTNRQNEIIAEHQKNAAKYDGKINQRIESALGDAILNPNAKTEDVLKLLELQKQQYKKQGSWNSNQDVRNLIGRALEGREHEVEGLNKKQLEQIAARVESLEKHYRNGVFGLSEVGELKERVSQQLSAIKTTEKRELGMEVCEHLANPRLSAKQKIELLQQIKESKNLSSEGLRKFIGDALEGREGMFIEGRNKRDLIKLQADMNAIDKQLGKKVLGVDFGVNQNDNVEEAIQSAIKRA